MIFGIKEKWIILTHTMYCCLLLQIYLCYLWLLLCSRDTYALHNDSECSVVFDSVSRNQQTRVNSVLQIRVKTRSVFLLIKPSSHCHLSSLSSIYTHFRCEYTYIHMTNSTFPSRYVLLMSFMHLWPVQYYTIPLKYVYYYNQ